MSTAKKLAIFASGNGTNAEKIVQHLQQWPEIGITLLCNKPQAGVITRAQDWGATIQTFDRKNFYEEDTVLNFLKTHNFDLIVLAGFLWLIPPKIIRAYEGKIINIHPALLPNFGGKGMYGHHVHEAVVNSEALFSGITIHFVTEKYDEGPVIFQSAFQLEKGETAASLEKKIHRLEHKYLPIIVEQQLEL